MGIKGAREVEGLMKVNEGRGMRDEGREMMPACRQGRDEGRVRPSSLFHLPSLIFFLMLLAGCGYTTKSALPPNLRTVHVAPFENKIIYTTDRIRNVYFPLLEVKIRDAVIDRFLFDGNLRIAEPDTANLLLKGELIRYERSPLRYTDNHDVEEYRVQISVNMTMLNQDRDEILWEESGFVGETTYFLIGPSAGTESAAVEDAMTDLARRIVERTIEDW